MGEKSESDVEIKTEFESAHSSVESRGSDVAQKHPRTIGWPFDMATTIALLALCLSVAQFFLTTPALLNLYYKAEVVVLDGPDSPTGRVSIFIVQNNGKAIAEKVEVSVVTFENDRVTAGLGGVIESDSSVYFRNHRIIFPYLSPGESTTIQITKTDPNNRTKDGTLGYLINEDGSTSDQLFSTNVPAVNYARLKEGNVRVYATQLAHKIVEQDSNETN